MSVVLRDLCSKVKNLHFFEGLKPCGLTVVDEASDPLPEVQAGDAGRRHVSASAHQLLHQVDVLVHHSNVERSHS